jgi:hypothetical protein
MTKFSALPGKQKPLSGRWWSRLSRRSRSNTGQAQRSLKTVVRGLCFRHKCPTAPELSGSCADGQRQHTATWKPTVSECSNARLLLGEYPSSFSVAGPSAIPEDRLLVDATPPCRLATAAIGSRSASRRIVTTCSSPEVSQQKREPSLDPTLRPVDAALGRGEAQRASRPLWRTAGAG